MITTYFVQLVEDDGTIVLRGMLSDADGTISTTPGFDELSNRTFTAADMPPEVSVRVTVAPNGGRVRDAIARKAAEVAERFGYRVERN